jgi:polar amino acid transport system substrate-binding protein
VDAVVIDNEPAKVFVSQNNGLKILETEYVIEEYAIAVAKGNTELLDKINAALAELTESGQIQAILDKYIKAE